LDLTAFRDLTGTHELNVYGLEHDAANWDWSEGSVEFDDAPGLEFDGNSTTRGLLGENVLKLGTLDASGLEEGDIAIFNNANLAVFLNLAAQFEDTSQAGLVTLILERSDVSGTRTRFASQEATTLDSGGAAVPAGTYSPRLLLDAVTILSPTSQGDYNHDGQVNAADYIVWRNSLGQSGAGLLADGDGNGTVDVNDYSLWRANFGRLVDGPFAVVATVPEPSSMSYALASVFVFWRQRSGVGRRRLGGADRLKKHVSAN
jgi:hypothetical protein